MKLRKAGSFRDVCLQQSLPHYQQFRTFLSNVNCLPFMPYDLMMESPIEKPPENLDAYTA